MLLLICRFICFCTIIPGLWKDIGSNNSILLSGKLKILPDSKIILTGKSNLSGFKCSCGSIVNEIEININRTPSVAVFNNAKLNICSACMECGNTLYNYNLKKCLQVDRYPTIGIELVYVQVPHPEDLKNCNQWFDVYTNTLVTIKDQTLLQEVKGKAMKTVDGKIRIKGNHVLKMSSYQIDPPVLMFGMVKVDNEITISIELNIEYLAK